MGTDALVSLGLIFLLFPYCDFTPGLACFQELSNDSVTSPLKCPPSRPPSELLPPPPWINPLIRACFCCAPLCRTRVTKEAGSVSLRMKQVEEL